jgi:protein-disulfide isomerase
MGRTPPPVRSKGGGLRPARRASPRTLAMAGAVVVLVALGIGLAVAFTGGNGSGGGTPLPAGVTVGNANAAFALPGAQEANNLFKGIPQNGLVLGNPQASVEMEMFIDVQCPICQNYEVNNLPTIVQKYIRTGKVQLHLAPWAFIGGAGSQSFSGRLGLIAASFQNKAFQYAKVLYDNQPPNSENTGWLDDAMMTKIAASVTGLNLRQWRAAKNGSDVQQIANAVDKLAAKGNVSGTPTIWVGPANGKLHDVAQAGYAPTLQQTEAALDQAISGV